MSDQLTYDLSEVFRHLAGARTLLADLSVGNGGQRQHTELAGHLSHAAAGLAAIHPEMAGFLRQFYQKLFCGKMFEAEISADSLLRIDRFVHQIKVRFEHGVYSGTPDEYAKTMLIELAGPRQSFQLPDGAAPCRCLQPNLPGEEPIDILIPLNAGGSKADNLELKIALRSIQKKLSGFRRIFVVSSRPPEGLRDLGFIECQDKYKRKQMNIHSALMTAFASPELSENVIFWADDNVLLQPLAAKRLPVVHRRENLLTFSNAPDAKVWHKSVRDTGEMLKERNYDTVNFESHTPVMFQKSKYLALDREFDFYAKAGLCYISLYLNVYPPAESVLMQQVKATFENHNIDCAKIDGKLFIGFNDAGFRSGVSDELLRRFPDKSPYEV